MIVKKGGKYQLQSRKTHKNLGTYSTRAGAEKRERQVQFFKHLSTDNEADYDEVENMGPQAWVTPEAKILKTIKPSETHANQASRYLKKEAEGLRTLRQIYGAMEGKGFLRAGRSGGKFFYEGKPSNSQLEALKRATEHHKTTLHDSDWNIVHSALPKLYEQPSEPVNKSRWRLFGMSGLLPGVKLANKKVPDIFTLQDLASSQYPECATRVTYKDGQECHHYGTILLPDGRSVDYRGIAYGKDGSEGVAIHKIFEDNLPPGMKFDNLEYSRVLPPGMSWASAHRGEVLDGHVVEPFDGIACGPRGLTPVGKHNQVQQQAVTGFFNRKASVVSPDNKLYDVAHLGEEATHNDVIFGHSHLFGDPGSMQEALENGAIRVVEPLSDYGLSKGHRSYLNFHRDARKPEDIINLIDNGVLPNSRKYMLDMGRQSYGCFDDVPKEKIRSIKDWDELFPKEEEEEPAVSNDLSVTPTLVKLPSGMIASELDYPSIIAEFHRASKEAAGYSNTPSEEALELDNSELRPVDSHWDVNPVMYMEEPRKVMMISPDNLLYDGSQIADSPEAEVYHDQMVAHSPHLFGVSPDADRYDHLESALKNGSVRVYQGWDPKRKKGIGEPGIHVDGTVRTPQHIAELIDRDLIPDSKFYSIEWDTDPKSRSYEPVVSQQKLRSISDWNELRPKGIDATRARLFGMSNEGTEPYIQHEWNGPHSLKVTYHYPGYQIDPRHSSYTKPEEFGSLELMRSQDHPEYFMVQGVGVDKPFRGEGYARDLFNHAHKLLQKEGIKGIISHPSNRNEAANKMWDKFGKQQLGEYDLYVPEENLGLDQEGSSLVGEFKRIFDHHLTETDKRRLSKPYSGLRTAKPDTVGGKPIVKGQQNLELSDDLEPLDGEHWIDEGGNAIFADGDVGELSHEGYAIDQAKHDLAEAAGYEEPSDYGLDLSWPSDKTKFYKHLRKNYPELNDALNAHLEVGTPYLREDLEAIKPIYDILGIPRDTWEVAHDMGHTDPRLWAAKEHGWTRMAGNSLQTVGISPSKMKSIAQGIWDAHGSRDDLDNQKFDLEVVDPEVTGSLGGNFRSKMYYGVPLSVLENGDMTALTRKDSNYDEEAAAEAKRQTDLIRKLHKQGREEGGFEIPDPYQKWLPMEYANLPPGMKPNVSEKEKAQARQKDVRVEKIARQQGIPGLYNPPNKLTRHFGEGFSNEDEESPELNDEDLSLAGTDFSQDLSDLHDHLYKFRLNWYNKAKNSGMAQEDLNRILKSMKSSHARLIHEYNKVMTDPVEYKRGRLRERGIPEELVQEVGNTESYPELMFSGILPGMDVLPDRPAEQTPRAKKPAPALDAIDPHKAELPPGMFGKGLR